MSSIAAAAARGLSITGFAPLPLAEMVPFMMFQSAAMMRVSGANWEAGKRDMKRMSNEEYNNFIENGGMEQYTKAAMEEVKGAFIEMMNEMGPIRDLILNKMVELEKSKVDMNVRLLKELPPEYVEQFSQTAAPFYAEQYADIGQNIANRTVDQSPILTGLVAAINGISELLRNGIPQAHADTGSTSPPVLPNIHLNPPPHPDDYQGPKLPDDVIIVDGQQFVPATQQEEFEEGDYRPDQAIAISDIPNQAGQTRTRVTGEIARPDVIQEHQAAHAGRSYEVSFTYTTAGGVVRRERFTGNDATHNSRLASMIQGFNANNPTAIAKHAAYRAALNEYRRNR